MRSRYPTFYQPQEPLLDLAQAIGHSVNAAENLILTRRAEMDMSGQRHKPLVVLAHEKHTNVAHLIHHILLMEHLQHKEPIALGVEQRHDSLNYIFKMATGQAPSGVHIASISEKNKDSCLNILGLIGYMAPLHNPHTHGLLFNFLLRCHIPVSMTDAAKTANRRLDVSDTETAQSVQDCFNTAAFVNEHINGEYSADMMQVRNYHTAKLGWQTAQDWHARIFIQQGGNQHALGDVLAGYEGRHSQAAYYKKLGAEVIAMPLDYNRVPTDHGLNDQDILLPVLTTQPPRMIDSMATNGEAEANYTRDLLMLCGLGAHSMTVDEQRQNREASRKALEDVFTRTRPLSPSV